MKANLGFGTKHRTLEDFVSANAYRQPPGSSNVLMTLFWQSKELLVQMTWQEALTLIDQLQAAAELAEEAERCNGGDPFDTAISQFEDAKWYKKSEF